MNRPFAVYVVHSPRLSERRRPCASAVAAAGWHAEWIERPDPGRLAWMTYLPHPRLTVGEVSVYLKHREVLRRVGAGDDERALVLEDDAVLPGAAAETLKEYLAAAPADADIIFFGSSYDLAAPPLPGNPRFGAGPRTRSMSGYLITRRAARLVSARLLHERVRWPIDITIDRYIRDGDIIAYWSVPPLIDNGSVSGRFRGSLTSRDWRSRPLAARLLKWLRAARR